MSEELKSPVPEPAPQVTEIRQEERQETQVPTLDELDTQIAKEIEKVEPAPVVAPVKDTPTQTTQEQPKLIADRYKTEAEFEKGILSLAKKAGMEEAVRLQMDIAKETKDLKPVELLYKKMRSALDSKKIQPLKQQPSPEKLPDDKELSQQVLALTMDEIQSSTLVREMIADGIQWPQNAAEWKALRSSAPYYATQIQALFDRTYNAKMEMGRNYVSAQRERDTVNEQVKSHDREKISSLATKYKITLDDDELDQIVDEAMSDPSSFESRHGVSMLKEGSVFRYFMAEKLQDRIDTILASRETEARKETLQDLERQKSLTPSSISSAGLSGKRSDPESLDYTDEKVLAKLPTERITERIDQLLRDAG